MQTFQNLFTLYSYSLKDSNSCMSIRQSRDDDVITDGTWRDHLGLVTVVSVHIQ